MISYLMFPRPNWHTFSAEFEFSVNNGMLLVTGENGDFRLTFDSKNELITYQDNKGNWWDKNILSIPIPYLDALKMDVKIITERPFLGMNLTISPDVDKFWDWEHAGDTFDVIVLENGKPIKMLRRTHISKINKNDVKFEYNGTHHL